MHNVSMYSTGSTYLSDPDSTYVSRYWPDGIPPADPYDVYWNRLPPAPARALVLVDNGAPHIWTDS